MQVRMADKDLIVVLLNSWGKRSRIGDANRVRKWLEKHIERTASAADSSS
jgi:serine-type D-Ala-D-Ala endopeptidase (penicillin-binding protein 7)